MTEQPTSLAEALRELQADMPTISKSGSGQVGSRPYAYSTLHELTDALFPKLAPLGLSFIAKPTMSDGQFVLAYSLLHTSGQREDGEYPLALGTPQQHGSAITYGRRYCLAAVTGAVSEDDDDGQAGGEAKPPRRRAQPRPKTAETGEQITEKQLKMMGALMREAGLTDRDAALAYVANKIGREIQSRNDLTTREASQVIDALMSDGDH